MRDAKQDTDLAALSGPPPDLKLIQPEPLVYHAWLEWKRTGRFFDSDHPPELQDATLREDVYAYDEYWEFSRAFQKNRRRGG